MTIANRLTFIRLCMAPIFFLLFWLDLYAADPTVSLTINVLLILLATGSEISDAIDGRLARARGEVTDFGKLFDPFADSVSRFTFFLCFWWADMFPAWMVIVLFYRDACISFLRLAVRGENVVIAARKSGKIKAVSQSIAIFLLLISRILFHWLPRFPVHDISWWVMFLVVIITVLSFVDYLRAHWEILRAIPK